MTPLVSFIFIYHVSMRRCVYGVRRAGLARSPPGRVGCTSPSLAGDLFFRKVHCVHFLLVPANIMGETGHKHYDNKIPLHEDSDGAVSEAPSFFPKQVYLWGSLLEKNRLDTPLGALGLVGRGFGPAGRAGLGWGWGLAVLGALAGLGVVLGVLWVGLAVLGALAGLGVGFGRAGRAGWVGRGVGRAGRGVGRGVWPCWARWLGWAWCWAWGLAVLGALAGLGVGFGHAGRAGWVGRAVGRGVWPRLARWLGWAWCWAPGLAVLRALAGLGVLLGVGFGRAGRAGWVGRGVGRRVWPCWAR